MESPVSWLPNKWPMEIPEQTNGQFHGIDTQKPWAFFDGSFKTMIRETWYKSLEALHKKNKHFKSLINMEVVKGQSCNFGWPWLIARW